MPDKERDKRKPLLPSMAVTLNSRAAEAVFANKQKSIERETNFIELFIPLIYLKKTVSLNCHT
jgi:hypothetical protein